MPANVTVCFTDRDFMTASPPITSFSFSEKEKEGKRKTAQGTAPRSEPRFAPADRDEIKSRGSMRLRPPRPPGERASRERQTTEMLCTAEKVSVFGAKAVCSASRAARPQLWLPLEGKLRPQAVMRCRFRLRNRFQTKKVTICFITRYTSIRSSSASGTTGHLSRCGSCQ